MAPTNQSATFDGIPWTSFAELVVIGLLAVSMSFSTLRGVLRVRIDSLTTRRYQLLNMGLLVLICVKTLGYFNAPTVGQFEVCYREAESSETQPCLPTFEPHPLLANVSESSGRRSTSVESIDYRSREGELQGLSNSTWRLPFVNTDSYDVGYWPWLPEDRNIEIVPFRAEFRGSLDAIDDRELVVRYVGEGELTVDERTTRLPPSYEVPREVRLPWPSEPTELSLHFAFLRTQTYSDLGNQPYAALQLMAESDGKESPATASIGGLVNLVNLLTDVGTLVIAVLVLVALRSRKHDAAWSAGLALVLVGFARLGESLGLQRISPIELEVIGLVAVSVFVLAGRGSALQALGSYLVVAWSFVRDELTAVTGVNPRLEDVIVRLRGNDHLVYEKFSRDMLTEGFLRGGEDVFYFQPGIRYYFHVMSVLFGDSGVVTGLVSVVLMGCGILFLLWQMKSKNIRAARLVLPLAVTSLIVWWSSSLTTQFTILGLSEFYTWIALFFIGGLTLKMGTKRDLIFVAVLAASAVLVRPNQGVAMLAIVLMSAFMCRDDSWSVLRKSIAATATYFGTLSWVPIHNLVFDGRLAFLPTSVNLRIPTQLTWGELAGVLSNQRTQDFLLVNLRAILYSPGILGDIYSSRLALAFVGFALVIAVLLFVRSRSTLPVRGLLPRGILLWAVVVAAQVVPFFKWTVIRYHPVQIIAIHITAVVMGLVLLSVTTSRVPAGEGTS